MQGLKETKTPQKRDFLPSRGCVFQLQSGLKKENRDFTSLESMLVNMSVYKKYKDILSKNEFQKGRS